MTAQQEKGHFDVADFANGVSVHLEKLNSSMEYMGTLLHLVHTSQEKAVVREIKKLVPDNTLSFNFKVLSIYVDNSQNADALTLTTENGVSFTVAANTQQWVHPMGCNYIDVSGTGTCPAMFVDTFLPIK